MAESHSTVDESKPEVKQEYQPGQMRLKSEQAQEAFQAELVQDFINQIDLTGDEPEEPVPQIPVVIEAEYKFRSDIRKNYMVCVNRMNKAVDVSLAHQATRFPVFKDA